MSAELFSNPDKLFGLECKEPWASLILTGEKTVETRLYALPPQLVGRPIVLMSTAADSGSAGVSGLSDHCPPGAASTVGLVTFGEVVRWDSRESWEAGLVCINILLRRFSDLVFESCAVVAARICQHGNAK